MKILFKGLCAAFLFVFLSGTAQAGWFDAKKNTVKKKAQPAAVEVQKPREVVPAPVKPIEKKPAQVPAAPKLPPKAQQPGVNPLKDSPVPNKKALIAAASVDRGGVVKNRIEEQKKLKANLAEIKKTREDAQKMLTEIKNARKERQALLPAPQKTNPAA